MTFNSATGMCYEGWRTSYLTLVLRRKEGLDKSPGFLNNHVMSAPNLFFRYVHEADTAPSTYPTRRTQNFAKFFKDNERRKAIWNSIQADMQLSNFMHEGDL